MNKINSIGRIKKLWLYPVKSLLGESLPELAINERGAVGDRWFAIKNSKGKFGSGKNTRRFVKIDGLFQLQAHYNNGIPSITFPDGRTLKVYDPTINRELSNLLKQPVELVSENRISHLDAESLHIFTSASLKWLQSLLPNSSIDERRFRSNILIDLPEKGLVENNWIGKKLAIGDQLKIEITELTERCIMTTLPQLELDKNPEIIKVIQQNANLCFGVYAKVLQPGLIGVDDRVNFYGDRIN